MSEQQFKFGVDPRTPAEQEAAKHPGDLILCIGGAASGKTYQGERWQAKDPAFRVRTESPTVAAERLRAGKDVWLEIIPHPQAPSYTVALYRAICVAAKVTKVSATQLIAVE